MMGFGMGFGGIWMIIFWIVIIGAFVLALAALFPRVSNANKAGSDDDALAILKRRYARGELSKEEYETMRHNLET
jgi:putative membrane protein